MTQSFYHFIIIFQMVFLNSSYFTYYNVAMVVKDSVHLENRINNVFLSHYGILIFVATYFNGL